MKKEDFPRVWQEWNLTIDPKVVDAFMDVDREQFVPIEFKQQAYEDHPLPILYGQTISQPTTVVIMTNLLDVSSGMKVLEVGAGSGYQAALLAKLVGSGKVITTEIIPELAAFARDNLKNAEIRNVDIIHYDGSTGYKKQAPYDRILVTAASPSVPDELVRQLKDPGILVVPVGKVGQRMLKITKKNGKIASESFGDFVFVPLTGKHGFKTVK